MPILLVMTKQSILSTKNQQLSDIALLVQRNENLHHQCKEENQMLKAENERLKKKVNRLIKINNRIKKKISSYKNKCQITVL